MSDSWPVRVWEAADADAVGALLDPGASAVWRTQFHTRHGPDPEPPGWGRTVVATMPGDNRSVVGAASIIRNRLHPSHYVGGVEVALGRRRRGLEQPCWLGCFGPEPMAARLRPRSRLPTARRRRSSVVPAGGSTNAARASSSTRGRPRSWRGRGAQVVAPASSSSSARSGGNGSPSGTRSSTDGSIGRGRRSVTRSCSATSSPSSSTTSMSNSAPASALARTWRPPRTVSVSATAIGSSSPRLKPRSARWRGPGWGHHRCCARARRRRWHLRDRVRRPRRRPPPRTRRVVVAGHAPQATRSHRGVLAQT